METLRLIFNASEYIAASVILLSGAACLAAMSFALIRLIFKKENE